MVIGLIAFLVTLVAVLAGAGHAGYLALMSSAAKKRPGGDAVVQFAKKRAPVAGGTLGVSVLALLISAGGPGADIVAILLGAGGGVASLATLRSSQSQFQSGNF